MNIQQAIATAKQGDTLLFHYRNPDIIADSIEWFEADGYVSHAALAIDSMGRIVQATAKDGVTISSIAEFAPDDVDIVIRRSHATQERLNALVLAAVQRLGKPYGFWQDAWDGFCLLMNRVGISWFLKWRSPIPKSQGVNCSSLIALSASDADVFLGINVPPESATPENLLLATALDTVSA